MVGPFYLALSLVDELPKNRLGVADDTQLGLEDFAELVRIDVDLDHIFAPTSPPARAIRRSVGASTAISP
jgi:hypothetical protein